MKFVISINTLKNWIRKADQVGFTGELLLEVIEQKKHSIGKLYNLNVKSIPKSFKDEQQDIDTIQEEVKSFSPKDTDKVETFFNSLPKGCEYFVNGGKSILHEYEHGFKFRILSMFDAAYVVNEIKKSLSVYSLDEKVNIQFSEYGVEAPKEIMISYTDIRGLSNEHLEQINNYIFEQVRQYTER